MTLSEQFPSLRSRRLGYALAVSNIALAALSFLYSNDLLGSAYLVPFAIAVAVATLFGLGPGLTALCLAIVATDCFRLATGETRSLALVTTVAAVHYALALLLTRLAQSYLRRSGRDQKIKLAFHRWLVAPAANPAAPTYLGRLDGAVDGEIYGWALDPNELSLPPKISVYADSRPIGETLPVYYRPDVGQHAFYFNLPRSAEPKSAIRIEARLPDGHWLPNSPLTLNATAPPPRRSPAVLFMHIPKTAGTAFREAILENYRQSEVAFIYPHPPGFLPCHWELLPLEQRAKFQLVIGHFQYGVHDLLPQESTYVTVVRNPVERVISHYYYMIEMEPELVHDGPGLLPLPELLERRRTVNLDNLMVRCFSGVDENQVPPGEIDHHVYDLAVHHLRKSFAYVGYQDRADDAYAALQKRFGWTARPSLATVNRGSISRAKDDPAIKAAIERCNSWDYRLYAEIRKLFPLDPYKS